MRTRLGALNEFCWMDLKTRDLAGTATFFSKTLGWRFAVDKKDWRNATKIAIDGHLIGGVSDLASPVYPPEIPAHVAYYLAVDNVDRRAEAARVNGARLVVPAFDAGDQGRMATLIDPVGAAFSLWQPHHFTGWTFPLHMAGAPHRSGNLQSTSMIWTAWLSVTVELLGGRGEELWPWPGRIFAVGPRHTFGDLAGAINDAFARWDRSHLSMFTLADGRVLTDERTGAEMVESIGGPLLVPLDIAAARVARTVSLGAEFQFTFDLGDDWIHRCVVAERKIDPVEVLGIQPEAPLPYGGWGSIPDQYGRRWDGDDGAHHPPARPKVPHPMLLHAWPAPGRAPALDMSELRGAIARQDAAGLLAAVAGRDIDDALQQVGPGIPMALASGGEQAQSVGVSVINRLTWRTWEGDDVLAADLLACLRHEPPKGRVVPVDLELLSIEREGDPRISTGGYVDLRTGQVYNEAATDPLLVGEDAAIDVEEDPDRWLPFDCTGSREGWRDMAAFAERQHDDSLRQRLIQAIQGTGAFRRFRDLVHEGDLSETWHTFSTDRQLGRARAFLAEEGIRVNP